MRQLSVLFLAAIILFACNPEERSNKETVNAVIGDISFIDKYGHNDFDKATETDRIATHLAYVERKLRERDVSHLPGHLLDKRNEILRLLHEYRLAKAYPSNYDYPDTRKPCFIDKTGNICAVGYLIEKTEGRELAEKINAQFQYDYICDIAMPELSQWVENSGLTLVECAMIQPSYGGTPYSEPDVVEPEYGFVSSVLIGSNAAFTTINAIQIGAGRDKNTIAILGMISGATQVAVGAINLDYYKYGPSMDESKNQTLSWVNIGLGTTSLIMGTCNLLINKERRDDKRTVWNVYTYPARDDDIGIGFSLTRRF
jgi:hypothetical protein